MININLKVTKTTKEIKENRVVYWLENDKKTLYKKFTIKAIKEFSNTIFFMYVMSNGEPDCVPYSLDEFKRALNSGYCYIIKSDVHDKD